LIDLEILNHGNSPATNIDVTVMICPREDDAAERLTALIDEVKRGTAVRAQVPVYVEPIFPQINAPHSFHAELKRDETLLAIQAQGDRLIQPSIIGMIEYKSAFSAEVLYTCFLGSLHRVPPETPTMLYGFNVREDGGLSEKEVPMNELSFVSAYFRGHIG
jgi:hypothetical protein